MLCSVQIEMFTFDAPLGKGGHTPLLQGGRLARALTIRSFLRARRVGDPEQPTVAEPGEVSCTASSTLSFLLPFSGSLRQKT